MGLIQQPWLTDLKKVESVGKKRKLPQPHLERFKEIKRYEILHRPFDLKFRGRINRWLINLIRYEGFDLDKTLSEENSKFVKLYYFPQGKRRKWLTQREVLKKQKKQKYFYLRKTLVKVLIDIWDKSKKKE